MLTHDLSKAQSKLQKFNFVKIAAYAKVITKIRDYHLAPPFYSCVTARINDRIIPYDNWDIRVTPKIAKMMINSRRFEILYIQPPNKLYDYIYINPEIYDPHNVPPTQPETTTKCVVCGIVSWVQPSVAKNMYICKYCRSRRNKHDFVRERLNLADLPRTFTHEDITVHDYYVKSQNKEFKIIYDIVITDASLRGDER